MSFQLERVYGVPNTNACYKDKQKTQYCKISEHPKKEKWVTMKGQESGYY